MDQNLAAALVFITGLIAATILIIALMNFRIRKRLIREHLMNDQTIKAMNQMQYDFKVDSLKWGLLFLFGGAGLVLLHFIPCKADSPLPYGIELIFLAVGFLIYFLITRPKKQP